MLLYILICFPCYPSYMFALVKKHTHTITLRENHVNCNTTDAQTKCAVPGKPLAPSLCKHTRKFDQQPQSPHDVSVAPPCLPFPDL